MKYWDKMKLNEDNTGNAIRSAQKLCENRFGYFTDPRFTARDNLDHLQQHYDPDDMPRRPDNLQLHNLCNDKSLVTDALLETLGLGLGHGVAMKQKDENPIDFDRLRRSVRIQFSDFDKDNDNDFNPVLHVQGPWQPEPAPGIVESAINDFEEKTNNLFDLERKIKILPIFDIKRSSIDLIRSIKKHRKLVITASDKGLGPTIMEKTPTSAGHSPII